MKKTLLALCLLGTIAVSAFQFRTSCGTITNVNPSSTYTSSELQMYLSGVNSAVCGTFVHPSSIVVYTHP